MRADSLKVSKLEISSNGSLIGEDGTIIVLQTQQGIYSPGLYYKIGGNWINGQGPKGDTGLQGPKGDPGSYILGATLIHNTQLNVAPAYTPYDIARNVVGKPLNNDTVLSFVSVRDFTLPLNLSGSIVFCTVPSTATSVFTIKKNGTQIGTITFNSGNTNANISCQTTLFTNSDLFSIVAPSPQDETLSDIYMTIAGNLQ